MVTKSLFTMSNVLTLIRLIGSPLILPVFFVYLLPINSIVINGLLSLLFIVLAITDFFDGYLARKYQQVTSLGTILDPIADKFLTYSSLIALLVAQKIHFYWVLILIGREFFVMGVRHIALEHGFSISVSWLAKFKTVAEMTMLAFIIFNPYQNAEWNDRWRWHVAELCLLGLATGLSVWTAYQYHRRCMTSLISLQQSKPENHEW